MLTFRDTGKVFELKEDIFKMIPNNNYNVDHAVLSDGKILYNFEKETIFDLKATGTKSTRDITLIKLLKSPGLIISASCVSKTKFLSSDPNEIGDRLLLQEKQAGNNSDIINLELVAIVDKLLDYNCICKKNNINNF